MTTNYNSVMVKRKVTYKLYPTAAQRERLHELLYLHKNLYNAALEERISAYQKVGLSVNYYDQANVLNDIKDALPEYKNVNAQALQQTLRRLNKAFSAFFDRCKKGDKPGFPRFKSVTRFKSITYGQHYKGGWEFKPGQDWKHGQLRLNDVGIIKARGKARTPGNVIKASEIGFRQGHWWLSLTVECEPKRECNGGAAIGLDWGVETFLSSVDSNNVEDQINNPRWFQTYKDIKADLQRQLASKKRFSRSWRKAKRKLANLESKIARKRLDFQHKVSATLAAEYACIATEKLSVKNMTKSAKGTLEKPGKNVKQKAGLNREILDTAPAQLYSLIKCKAEEAGSLWLETPTRSLKPSQRCPKCWQVKRKTLSERIHQCDHCGHTENRDIASARVNLRYALEYLSGRESCLSVTVR